MITVVNKRTHKPTSTDVYVGRGSVLGNPYTGSKDIRNTKANYQVANREEAIESYHQWLDEKLADGDKRVRKALNDIYLQAKNGNVNLVCYCKPHDCHGDVIKDLIERKMQERGIRLCPSCNSPCNGTQCNTCCFDASEIDIY
jgi:hypothetical protein